MKYKWLLNLCYLLSANLLYSIPFPDQYPFYLSVCAVFNDEALYLKEWIEYHKLIGVERFILYNNDSADDFITILQPYIDQGVVELIDWPSALKNRSHLEDQKKAYKDCVIRYKNQTYWLAVIDIDEFIVPVKHENLADFLKQYDHDPNLGSYQVNWQLFGTSHLEQIPHDKLLIESLIYKAPWDYCDSEHSNLFVKSIIRPHGVRRMDIHSAVLKNGYYCLPFLTASNTQKVKIDEIRINHYWTRSRDYFFNFKLARLLRWSLPHFNYNEDALISAYTEKEKKLNQEEDSLILRHVPELRERMGLAPLPARRTSQTY